MPCELVCWVGKGSSFRLETQAGTSSYKATGEGAVFLRNLGVKINTEGLGVAAYQAPEVRDMETARTTAPGGLDGGLKWT